ncbi:Sec1-like protein [Naematelia encephala]|uniref:Sec1-like protein n=1 Tax=Naematelia encephala TaxID=71784 RepID=A0A1Y2BIM6_9TREE|nr:Sec1-like protein [Naematelia encephala]
MSLKTLLRARFNSAIKSIPPGIWKVLITDDHSHALLQTVYKEPDILQMNVTSIEPLHSQRHPMSVDAIYLLTPTSQNVDRIIADFTGRRTYKTAHLYFIDGIDDRLAAKLTQSLPPDVLAAFTELYCNFWALEERVFTMQTPSAFFSMFGALGGAASAEMAMEAFEDDILASSRHILNLLATVNENPYIRYYQPHHHAPLGALAGQSSTQNGSASLTAPQHGHPQSLRWRSAVGSSSPSGGRGGQSQEMYLSRKLAMQVQADLDEYMNNNPEFPAPSSRPKAVLFIVDRSMDPAVPLLHEFWYQAMVNDLLKIDDGVKYKYTYENTVGGKEEKIAELTEHDPVWTSVRHLHMKDAIDTLMTNFGKFAQEHAGFRGGGQVNVNDLKDMLASLPQFQTQREQFSLHLDMAQECMGVFERKKLSLAANVEQCCATGYTPEGKTPKNVVEEMVPLLDDRNMTNIDKVRIIALYIMFREGVADEDRRRLYQHARLSLTEQDAVNNLVHLGVQVIKDSKNRSKQGRIKQKYHQAEGEYELSRYRPVAQMILEDHHNNRLDQSFFPFLRDAPPELSNSLRAGNAAPPPAPSSSLRSARPTWHKAPSARMANTEGRQRMILFIAGGMTYSEMRLAYTVGQALGKEILIGSTHIITPESFVKDLKALGRGGIGGNPPTGMPGHPQTPARPARSPGQPPSYQQILDKRYWVPPVGPPQLAPPQVTPQPQHHHQKSTKRPEIQQPNSFSSAISGKMSEMSLKDTKLKQGKEGKEKKGLFGKLKL